MRRNYDNIGSRTIDCIFFDPGGVETSKAAVEKMIANIKVPLLIVYDGADSIQGKGSITRRDTIGRISLPAHSCRRFEIQSAQSSHLFWQITHL